MNRSLFAIPIVLCVCPAPCLAADQAPACRRDPQPPLFGLDAIPTDATPPPATPRGCPCDCAEPFGILDVMDLVAFINDFQPPLYCGPCADLDVPLGICTLDDIVAFINCYLSC
jgi:hypothetical protein